MRSLKMSCFSGFLGDDYPSEVKKLSWKGTDTMKTITAIIENQNSRRS